MALPYHSQHSASVFYVTFVYMLQSNFKRTIRTLYFELQFAFAFCIDYYKMALHFNLVTVYKGVNRTWKDIFLGKFYSIEFSKAAQNGALWKIFEYK